MKLFSKLTGFTFIAFTFLVALTSTAFAFVLSGLMDLIVRNDVALLIKATVAACVFTAISVGFTHLHSVWKQFIVKSHMKKLKMALYEHYITLSHQAFQETSVGGILNQLTQNTTQYQQLYLESVLNLPNTIFSLILAVVATVYIDYRLLIIMVGFGILTSFLTRYTSVKMSKATAEMMQANDAHMRLLKDQFSGHFVIQSSNLTSSAREKMSLNTEAALCGTYRQKLAMLFMMNASMLLGLMSTVIIMGIASIFAAKGLISVGMVLAVSQLMGKIVSPVSAMGQLISGLKAGINIKKSFEEILKSTDTPVATHLEIEPIQAIEVRHLNFSYDKPLLKDLSHTFCLGKKYAIVGDVGSGKSTYLKLIGGMVATDAVFYNGKAQKNIAKEALWKQVAFVPQLPYLFESSLYDNLTLGQTISDARLQKVLTDVGLMDKVKTLPNGLNTLLTEGGQCLSGGEKQKVALARAVLSEKPILLLDEYTSSMDEVASEQVQRYVSGLGKMTIFITHKRQDYDVKHADEVIELSPCI